MDEQRHRELACLALGASLVDSRYREKLGDTTLHTGSLSHLWLAIADKDGQRVWDAVEREWGITGTLGEQRVIDAVFAELGEIESRAILRKLVDRMATEKRKGNGQAAVEILDQMKQDLLKGAKGE